MKLIGSSHAQSPESSQENIIRIHITLIKNINRDGFIIKCPGVLIEVSDPAQ